MSSPELKQTPLHKEHLTLGAKMVAFGGWDMPVQYEGILAEHKATREGATLFDISHMGEFVIEGHFAKSGLDRIVTQNLESLPILTSRYGMILNDQGKVIDDLIVFRVDEEKWFIVVNASTASKDAAHFRKHLTKNSSFLDVSSRIGKLDLQGPKSCDLLKEFVPEIVNLKYFAFDSFTLFGEKAMISRTGYTGELGYEIFYPWEKTVELWKALLKNDTLKPAGLGARDCLRLEVGYSLYGHELNEERSALESGLKKFIDFEKDFIGKAALVAELEKGVEKTIVGIVSDNRKSPREHQSIYADDHTVVGEVTSGSFSPCLGKGIGMALVKNELAKSTQKIFFGDDKNKSPAMITSKLFYKNGSVKNI